MRRSDWLTFSAVILIIAGILRVIDAIWAFSYHGALPDGLQGALLGHSLTTYGWIWLVAGVILIGSGALLFGPSDRPSAEIAGQARCECAAGTQAQHDDAGGSRTRSSPPARIGPMPTPDKWLNPARPRTEPEHCWGSDS